MKTITNYIKENLFDINNDTDILIGSEIFKGRYTADYAYVEKIDNNSLVINGTGIMKHKIELNYQSDVDKLVELYKMTHKTLVFNIYGIYICPAEKLNFKGLTININNADIYQRSPIENLNLKCQKLNVYTQKSPDIPLNNCIIKCDFCTVYNNSDFPKMNKCKLTINSQAELNPKNPDIDRTVYNDSIFYKLYKYFDNEYIEVNIDKLFNLKERNIDVSNIYVYGTFDSENKRINIYNKYTHKYKSLLNGKHDRRVSGGKLDSTGNWILTKSLTSNYYVENLFDVNNDTDILINTDIGGRTNAYIKDIKPGEIILGKKDNSHKLIYIENEVVDNLVKISKSTGIKQFSTEYHIDLIIENELDFNGITLKTNIISFEPVNKCKISNLNTISEIVWFSGFIKNDCRFSNVHIKTDKTLMASSTMPTEFDKKCDIITKIFEISSNYDLGKKLSTNISDLINKGWDVSDEGLSRLPDSVKKNNYILINKSGTRGGIGIMYTLIHDMCKKKPTRKKPKGNLNGWNIYQGEV